MKPSRLLPTRRTYEDGLALAFAHFNDELFDHSLPQPLFTLRRRRNSLGYFGAARFASRSVDGAVAQRSR